MQMVLVHVTGHALANSPLIKKFLQSIARASRTPARAIIITTFVAAVASWINWGFGLVVGALLGREMAKEIKGLDYRLLIASAYMGFLVWHGGLSGSIPLALATETDWSYEITGGIMVGDTIFSTQTLAIAIVLILTLPILARLMMPKENEVVAIDPELLKASEVKQEKFIPATPAEKVENSWIISLILFVGAVIFLVHYFSGGGILNLNIVNFIFLFAGIALHGTPRRYIMALYSAVKNAGGIILQFPFYAGIMGMMTSSGLAAVIPTGSSPSPQPIPCHFLIYQRRYHQHLCSFRRRTVGVQGPSCCRLPGPGCRSAKTAMGIAWGDAWTNMITVLGLAALGIAGLNARTSWATASWPCSSAALLFPWGCSCYKD